MEIEMNQLERAQALLPQVVKHGVKQEDIDALKAVVMLMAQPETRDCEVSEELWSELSAIARGAQYMRSAIEAYKAVLKREK
jgi:hypothetical protein